LFGREKREEHVPFQTAQDHSGRNWKKERHIFKNALPGGKRAGHFMPRTQSMKRRKKRMTDSRGRGQEKKKSWVAPGKERRSNQGPWGSTRPKKRSPKKKKRTTPRREKGGGGGARRPSDEGEGKEVVGAGVHEKGIQGGKRKRSVPLKKEEPAIISEKRERESVAEVSQAEKGESV